MKTVLMVYKLKRGVSIEEYKKWSREVDQPLINSFDVIKEFDIQCVVGPDKRWDCFEIVKVESIEAFEKLMRSDVIKKQVEDFEMFADKDSIRLVYGEKIE